MVILSTFLYNTLFDETCQELLKNSGLTLFTNYGILLIINDKFTLITGSKKTDQEAENA